MENIIEGREAIIAEYLIGDTTYRKLGAKYGIDFRRIHSWVMKYQGKPVKKDKPKIKQETPLENEELPTDVKQLQKELRKAKLHNKLLNAIIDIAEEQLKIDIRKKSGTKQ
jgi:transposase-like protein